MMNKLALISLLVLTTTLSVSDPSVAQSAAGVYRIGPEDVLHIDVYKEDDLTGDYTVDHEGRLIFPLLGEVIIGGKSIRETTELLTRLLDADYLFNPQINVTVKQYKSKKVEVLGGVKNPGPYYLERPTQLFDLLARAGGLSRGQGELRPGHQLRITRQEGDGFQRIDIDLYQLLVEAESEVNILLHSGDSIYVPESRSVHVIGEVKKPGSYTFEAGMTVLKAVTLAGGPNTKARLKKTLIHRIREGKEVKIEMSLEDELEADDIVEVKKSFW